MASRVGIGLDIGDDQVRVVRLRRTRRGVVLERMASARTPDGTVTGGIVREPRPLADCIRRLLRSSNIGGSGVVAGLSGRAAVSRSLELPAMHKDELRAVVAGELEHYRMVPTGQSTFDTLPLGETDGAQRRTRLLVMAADRNVVDKYRETLRLAGRHMLALEPALPAFCRAAYPFVNEGGTALVAVGPRTTELAVFCSGTLCYCRQIDAGALDLLNRGLSSPSTPVQSREPEQGPSRDGVQLAPVESTQTDLGSLVYELQRSLDFYHREMPASSRVERLVLCGDIEGLPGLGRSLEESLRLPMSVCQPSKEMVHRDSEITSDELTRVGPSYACAIGLALRAVGEVPEVPYLDLSVTGREGRLAKLAPKWLTGSLGISIILVIAALVTSLVIGRVLGARKQALATAKAELQRVAQIEQERTKAARRAREAITLVELRGLPWSDILFQVSEFMPEGVWLTNLRSQSTNALSLEGMALSADAVADLMEYLTYSPLFEMPRMTHIQKTTVARRPVLQYQITVSVVPPGSTQQQSATAPVEAEGAL